MTWLTWRLHRAQLVVLAAITALASLVLLQAGRGIEAAFRASGLADCFAAGGGCHDLSESFMQPYDRLVFIIPLFLAFPVVLGMLWGAPLVAREFEQGTHRLAWTQTVSRRRWLLTKVGVLLGATVALSGLLTAAVTSWSGPLLRASDERFLPGFFDLRGVVPVAYAVFAVSLGVAIGTLVRKTVPAVGLTLLGYAMVRAAITFFARPRFAQAITVTYPFSNAEPRRGMQDWPVSVVTVDRLGHVFGRGLSLDVNALARSCPGLEPGGGGLPAFSKVEACVRHVGLTVRSMVQPGDRFWTFQWIEFAIYLALAVALIGAALLVVRRRSA